MEIAFPQLPFLTREMLKFGNKTPMRLRLSAAASLVGEVNLRAVTRNGIIALNVETTADGVVQSDTVGIDDIPILVSAVDEGDSFLPGQCWANISLEFAEEETISLGSGFVYVDKGIMWPSANHQDAVPNRGDFATVKSANPAAGTEAALTIPAGQLWRILAAHIQLATDATVVNRSIRLALNISGGQKWIAFNVQAQTASTTYTHHFAHYGYANGEVSGAEMIYSLPQNIWLTPGSTIATDTLNLQAGDDYGIMVLIVEKFMAQS